MTNVLFQKSKGSELRYLKSLEDGEWLVQIKGQSRLLKDFVMKEADLQLHVYL